MRIHRLSPVVEEVLYQQWRFSTGYHDWVKGPAARSVKLICRRFPLIELTTRAGSLTSPLRDRFGYCATSGFYQGAGSQYIVSRGAPLWGLRLGDDGALEVARRARGTPRIANRLLRAGA